MMDYFAISKKKEHTVCLCCWLRWTPWLWLSNCETKPIFAHCAIFFIFFHNLRQALLWVGRHKKLVGFQWPTHPSTNYKISAGKLSIGPTEVLALPLWVAVKMKRPLLTTLFFFLSSSESLLFYQTGCSRVPKLLGFYVLGEIFEV